MRSLLSLLALAILSTQAQAGPLNDTGITFCGSASSGNQASPCIPDPAGQDRQYGRDAAAVNGVLNKTGTGAAGFDFTKIANNGAELNASAVLGSGPTDWACIRDNITGLTWEVKTDDDGTRDKDRVYTHYNDTSRAQKWNASLSMLVTPTQDDLDAPGNSVGYAQIVNAAGLCGAGDWRLPTRQELLSIVHLGLDSPAIDTDHFPNTAIVAPDAPTSGYWTSDTYAPNEGYAWTLMFGDGRIDTYPRHMTRHVRLVRP